MADDETEILNLEHLQCVAVKDVISYNLEERGDVLDEETNEWMESRLQMIREDSAIPIEEGDGNQYRRFSREFARAVQGKLEDEREIDFLADFYEEHILAVINEIENRTGGSYY